MAHRLSRIATAAGLASSLAVANVSPARVTAAPQGQVKVLAQAMAPPRPLQVHGTHAKLLELIGRITPRAINFSRRAPHIQGIRTATPQMDRRPPENYRSRPDPHAMSSTYRQTHGIKLSLPLLLTSPSTPGHVVSPPTLIPSSASRAQTSLRRTLNVNSGASPLTGINSWWTFEGGAIPGVGQYAVNVAQGGNLIVQAPDMMIPHKGVPLAFTRVYNSLSQHDYVGSDGSQVSNYGASWTNNFDAHLAYNSGNQNGQGISVFDVDGARYDYTPDGQGNWTPPAGQFATLTWDQGNGYYWSQKSGVIYHFWAPWFAGTSWAGMNGRLYTILGRNNNTSLSFEFYFANGDNSCACNLTDLYVVEEDGRYAHLSFTDFSVNGQNQRLLSTLTWPNGTVVAYGYDSNGNLAEVDGPPSNTYSTNCQGGLSSCVPQQYVYNGPSYAPGYTLMSWAYSPRLVMNNEGYTESAGPAGTGVTFGYDLSNGNALVGLADYGYMNPSPPDGSGAPIQSGVSSLFGIYRYVGFSRDYVSTTNAWDSDNHSRTYAYDGIGRVTEFSAATGSTTLSSVQSWDVQNDLISVTDPRGNETDAAFDNNGNLIAVALPSVTTSDGTFRPTTLYSYDPYNNLTAACDPHFSHYNSLDWTSRPSPSDSLCPVALGSEPSSPGASFTVGSTSLTWASTSAEPFKELQTVTNAAGYTTSYSYAASQEGGSEDYGLPTKIAGSNFSQYDNTYVQPLTYLTYDTYGDVLTANDLAANQGSGTSSFSYDNNGRLTSATDADGVQSHFSYYTNNLLELTQTAAQYAAAQYVPGMGVAYLYDADGNPTSETHNYACAFSAGSQPPPCTQGVTYRWYDGADRLVEVSLPNDSTDYYPSRWLTRYIYDLAQGQQVTIGNVGNSQYGTATVRAYGNLYKQQTWVTGAIQSYNNPGSNAQWFDQKGSSFDALDRQVKQYDYQPGGNLQATNVSYDATSATLGLETSSTSAIGDVTSYAYDNVDRVSNISFTNNGYSSEPTAARNYLYDADSRVQSVATTAFGTESYQYTPDGNIASITEPTGGTGLTYSGYGYSIGQPSSPAVLSYSYYPNGWRQGMAINSNSLTQNNIKQYSYRADGLVQKRSYAAVGQSVWQSLTYTAAGRPTGSSDFFDGSAEALAYNQFGQLSSLQVTQIGGGTPPTFSGIQHDLEGKVLSYNINPPEYGTYGPTSISNTYNIRGELLSQDCQNPTLCASAHGFLYPPDNTDYCAQYGPHGWDTACGTGYTKFDARNGANLGTYVNFTSFSGPNNQNGRPSASYYSTPIGYDPDGRNMGGGVSGYDVENHVALMTSPQSTEQYAYGPDGNLSFSSLGNSYSATYRFTHHWDASALLMTTDANAAVQNVLFDKTANMTPQTSYSGVTFFDRDFTGTIASAHNASGYDGVAWPLSDSPNCGTAAGAGVGGQSGFAMGGTCGAAVGSNYIRPLPFFWRTDAYFDNYNVIEGARSYNANAGQWSSMDSYGGSVMDPMSEQPYVWNGNDPISNVDPSGFFCEEKGHYPDPNGTVSVPDSSDYSTCYIGGMEYGDSVSSVLGPTLGEMIFVRDLQEIGRVIARIRARLTTAQATTLSGSAVFGGGLQAQAVLDTCARVYAGGGGTIGGGKLGGNVGATFVFPKGQPLLDMPTSAQIANVISSWSESYSAQAIIAVSYSRNAYGSSITIGIGPGAGATYGHSYNYGPKQLGIGCKSR
jgi:YD repeat-containing protein